MAIDDNVIIRQQVRGTTALIQQYAGAEGQIVFNTDTKNLHIMSGTAGTNTVIPCMSTVNSSINSAIGSIDWSPYLKKSEASSLYATKAEAGNNLTEEEADDIYWRKDEKVTSATQADRLTSTRTISLTGAVIGSGTFRGDNNAQLACTSVAGSMVTGTVPAATKATQDGNGAVIANTYRKKSTKIVLSDLNITDYGMVGSN